MKFIKYGLTFLAGMIVGAAALIGVVVSLGAASLRMNTVEGPLSDYAQGEMSKFITLETLVLQSEAPLTNEQGETVFLRDYEGQLLLVNYWASWCAPCLVELPGLDALQGAYDSEEFELIIVAVDDQEADSRRAYERLALNHLAFHYGAPNEVYPYTAEGGPLSLPLTVLYDRNGIEIGRLSGEADWNGPDARALLDAALTQF